MPGALRPVLDVVHEPLFEGLIREVRIFSISFEKMCCFYKWLPHPCSQGLATVPGGNRLAEASGQIKYCYSFTEDAMEFDKFSYPQD
jgi:hypothetical protein